MFVDLTCWRGFVTRTNTVKKEKTLFQNSASCRPAPAYRNNFRAKDIMTNFSDELIQKVWEKGFKIENIDADVYRKDAADAWIQRDKYGKQEEFGWSIDHVYPQKSGGDKNINNLRPLHWENNNSKSDNYPNYRVVKTADGNKNIAVDQLRIVHEKLQEKLSLLYHILTF